MKFKLDENLGSRAAQLVAEAGHQVETVRQERLGGAADDTIFEVCIREHSCLITLDLDFADIIRFPCEQTAGIAVLRLPKHPSVVTLTRLLTNLLDTLKTEPIAGRLWIVELTRIRMRGQ
jgi:predicted nuclease of predicted toxin-antitoxin system